MVPADAIRGWVIGDDNLYVETFYLDDYAAGQQQSASGSWAYNRALAKVRRGGGPRCMCVRVRVRVGVRVRACARVRVKGEGGGGAVAAAAGAGGWGLLSGWGTVCRDDVCAGAVSP